MRCTADFFSPNTNTDQPVTRVLCYSVRSLLAVLAYLGLFVSPSVVFSLPARLVHDRWPAAQSVLLIIEGVFTILLWCAFVAGLRRRKELSVDALVGALGLSNAFILLCVFFYVL